MPEASIRAFQSARLKVVHAWGMTETAPLGSVSRVPSELAGASDDVLYAWRARQGRPAPLVEIRARGEDGSLVPWDDHTMGELEVRGNWIAAAYYPGDEAPDRWTDDGWFRTGDIVTIADCASHPGSREGSHQVGRRVDQHGGARVAALGHPEVPRPWSGRPSPAVGRAPARGHSAEARLRAVDHELRAHGDRVASGGCLTQWCVDRCRAPAGSAEERRARPTRTSTRTSTPVPSAPCASSPATEGPRTRRAFTPPASVRSAAPHRSTAPPAAFGRPRSPR
jgi:hypothetical protein